MPQLSSVAAALLLAVGVASCSQTLTPTPIEFDEPLPWDPGPDVGGRALQQRVFADGVVTFDEYELATVATIECMRDEGFAVEGPLRYPDGYIVIAPGWDPTHQLTYVARVTEDPSDEFDRVQGRCTAQWSYAIERIYMRQFAPTEDEIRVWLERAWACRAEKGLPVSDPPTDDEATEAVSYGCRPWEKAD